MRIVGVISWTVCASATLQRFFLLAFFTLSLFLSERYMCNDHQQNTNWNAKPLERLVAMKWKHARELMFIYIKNLKIKAGKKNSNKRELVVTWLWHTKVHMYIYTFIYYIIYCNGWIERPLCTVSGFLTRRMYFVGMTISWRHRQIANAMASMCLSQYYRMAWLYRYD